MNIFRSGLNGVENISRVKKHHVVCTRYVPYDDVHNANDHKQHHLLLSACIINYGTTYCTGTYHQRTSPLPPSRLYVSFPSVSLSDLCPLFISFVSLISATVLIEDSSHRYGSKKIARRRILRRLCTARHSTAYVPMAAVFQWTSYR